MLESGKLLLEQSIASHSDMNGPRSFEPEEASNTAALGRTAREKLPKPQSQNRLLKRRRVEMAICNINARTFAPEAFIEDSMTQARKIKHDVIGLIETRRHRSLHLYLRLEKNCSLENASAEATGSGFFVNTLLAMNFDSYESLTTRIGCLRSRRCGSIPSISVAYAPTSSYDEEELEAFHIDLERLYKEDHTFFKVIVGDFKAKIGRRRTVAELRIGTHGMEWNEQDEGLSEFIIDQ